MPARSNDKRWNSKFARFVDALSTRKKTGVERLALGLGLSRAAIYQWVSGEAVPRPLNAQKIVKFAKQRGIELSFEDIYEPGSH